jgi:hypothetical protein
MSEETVVAGELRMSEEAAVAPLTLLHHGQAYTIKGKAAAVLEGEAANVAKTAAAVDDRPISVSHQGVYGGGARANKGLPRRIVRRA